MKEIELEAGEHIEKACERLAQESPAFMVLNGIRVEAQKGDSPGDLRARWSASMDRVCEEHEAKRRAFEQTPEDKAQLAEAARRKNLEEIAHAEAMQYIADSGVREKYPWEPGMGEISGFGGGYESACRDMLYAGLAWLDKHPDADLKATTYRGVYGILNAVSDDAKVLDRVLMQACPGCSGAMHQATMSACMYVAKNGWRKYAESMSRKSP